MEVEVMTTRRKLAGAIMLVLATIVSGLGIYVRANAHARVPEKEIRITAKNFDFTPNVITVKKGEPVVLVISSQDRKHGFSLRAFGIRADINPGGNATVRFTPNKAGKFSFSCDVFCGEGHEDMTGSLVVTE
jgi:cytochrome c oxidase subunit 2